MLKKKVETVDCAGLAISCLAMGCEAIRYNNMGCRCPHITD
jgi:hypothetical protein